MNDEQFTLATRRRPRPVRRKITIEVDAEGEALLRAVGREWGLSLGDTAAVAVRCLVASGWSEREELTIGDIGRERIAAVLARAVATAGQPVPDPRLYGGAGPRTSRDDEPDS